MNNVLVIADDLTGAAEIAGIALRFGMPARLVREPPSLCGPGLTVIDTDSRLLPPTAAAETVARYVRGLTADHFDLIYKKTDSVLRGPVVAELDALSAAFDRRAVLLVPQNPSRGRTIRNGEYFVDGVPLHKTAFANDPQHPARTANVTELLDAAGIARYAELGGELPIRGIVIGGAVRTDELRDWAERLAPHVLPAGGADFFQALLERSGCTGRIGPMSKLQDGSRLFVCGSASAHAAELVARARRENVSVCPMPESQAAAVPSWFDAVIAALRATSRAVMCIGRPLDRSPGAAQRLQSTLAAAVAEVLARQPVSNLLMEGGATGSEVCRAMGWRQFDVRGELASGVVQMRALDSHHQSLVVKPGSYRWSDSVWDQGGAEVR